ncbi:aldo/keto reductase [Blautia liquoris]|uniref:Aldo/keto reductase n=1 Tax=Blautia liquoris TaxID=2779518 RepID=A0A7M2RGK4_9FIRM|nr:aldo/keto reductase [Blautia liquoris]QOV18667.1 aldo/keto reductase [Blautia liquoris]
MRYKHFERADVDVSALAIGTWALGGDSFGGFDLDKALRAIYVLLDKGVNLIDTAPCYGNGTSEKIVGKIIKEIDRSKIMISTKCGLIPDINTCDYIRNASYKNLMREIESSLMNLNTDYIDFYFVHWPDVSTPIAETMSALMSLKERGFIRHIGVSNFSKEQIEEAEKFGQIDVQQPPFSMVEKSSLDLMLWGREKGIDTLTYGSMGGGVLSGKYRKVPQFGKGDVRGSFYDFFKEPKFSKIMELLKVLDRIAGNHDKQVSQVALNWSTQKDYVGTALVGVRSKEHAYENLETFEWKLSDEEMKTIDDTIDRLEL